MGSEMCIRDRKRGNGYEFDSNAWSACFYYGGLFCSTSLFYKESEDKNKVEADRFFKNLETPVIADDLQDDFDRQQRNKLGGMVMCMSAGILLMSMIPNPIWGRMVFVVCAVIIGSIGFMLRRSAMN